MTDNNYRVVYLGDRPEVVRAICEIPQVDLAGCLIEPLDDHSEIRSLAETFGFSVYEVWSPLRIQDALRRVGNLDMGVITNFGVILSKKNMAFTQKGFINAHMGLLPENPGRHPIRSAIQQGQRFTGVTLHWVEERVDSGSIIDQKIISIGFEANPAEVFDRLVHWVPVLLRKHLLSLLSEREAPLLVPDKVMAHS